MDEVSTRYKAPAHAFPSTCWNVIAGAAGKNGKEADLDSLQTFCVSYWYPLYAWARQTGLKAQDAEDLTQGFFARLIEKDFLAAADEGKGRLRSFLIMCLKRHARDARERDQAGKRDARKTVSLDFEWAAGQFESHSDPAATPDVMYDRRWAHALLHYALGRLGDSMAAAGKTEMFAAICFLREAPERAIGGVFAALRLPKSDRRAGKRGLSNSRSCMKAKGSGFRGQDASAEMGSKMRIPWQIHERDRRATTHPMA